MAGHSVIIKDQDLIKLWQEVGLNETSRRTGLSLRGLLRRRRRLEILYNTKLQSPHGDLAQFRTFEPRNPRSSIEIKNGIALIGSDPHYWPAPASLMHRAFVFLAKEYGHEIKLIIMNGDVIDAATISKYPGNWEKRPTMAEELDAAKDRLHEIELACKAPRFWTLGNHDDRFERLIATRAPELAKVHGVHLKDHFPNWEPTMSVWINNEVVVKHNWKGGRYAPMNNTIYSGKSMVTGHLHAAQVTVFTDYDGDRYGVDNGTMADIYGPQFAYVQDNCRDWRSAFCKLEFKDGKLMYPQLVLPWGKKQVQLSGDIFTP
jgi:hypothetical protein